VILLQIFETVTVILSAFFFLYLAVLSALAWSCREETQFSSRRLRRIAVVVPAHNEELAIGETLKSLQSVEYPKGLFDIIVIADNCSDMTAEVAEKAGVLALVRTEPQLRGKGYALRWCFDRLMADLRNYEAVVVVDADSLVSRNFLLVMNHYLDTGAKAIQSSDLAAHAPGDWSLEMTRLSFLLHNFVRPLGRSVLGFSAGLKGNGMCFAIDTLIEVPWESYSTNEDLEYGMELLLRGKTVVFAPEAKVHATMPLVSANAQSQRARWEKGRMPLIRRYAWRLFSSAARQASLRLFDAFVELMTPSLVNIGVFSLVMAFVSNGLWVLGIQGMRFFGILWLSVLCAGAIHVVIGLIVAKAGTSAILTMRHIPKYFLWKLKIYSGSTQTAPSHEWVRTTREPNAVPVVHEDPLTNGDSQ
jgi:1,2-diacylglycerol 3-beta-glucosyltransferase